MLSHFKVFLIIAIPFIFTACTDTKILDNPITTSKPEALSLKSFELSGKWIRYTELIPSTQTAFCRNLFNGTNLETFKFQNWIAEINTLSRYGDNKYKVNLETPCSTIETKGKWTVLSENPIYSQLAKVEKGKAVFISGSYTVTKNSSNVDLNYFSIAW